MLQHATLQVLADLAEIGLPEAVDVPLAAFDPFFRSTIRKRVRRALALAGDRTTSQAGDHALRLAFVLAHPSRPEPLDPNDVVAIGEAYRRLSAPFTGVPVERVVRYGPSGYRAAADPHAAPALPEHKVKKRFWPVTTPLLLLVAATGLGAAALYALPYLTPTEDERFQRTALGKSLGEPLTDFVSTERQGGDADAKALLLAPTVRAQVGPDAMGALEQLLDLVPKTSALSAESVDEAMAPVFAAVNTFDARLADRKIPALVHAYAQGEPGERSVWVTSYFVRQRTETTLDGQTLHAAWGRRIDSLNLLDPTLYKGDAEDWIVLSLDRVEEDFDQTLLPPIAKGTPMGPEEYDATDTSPRAELARTAGRLLAEELIAASHLTASEAESVYRALATRNEATRDLAKKGYRIEPTSRLQLSPWIVRSMTKSMETDRDHAPLIEELLKMNERMGIYRKQVASAVDQLALLEEEVFVARLFDQKRLANTKVAKLADLELDSPWTRTLLSSQLATLARRHDCPRLALWRVAGMASLKGYSSAYYDVTTFLWDTLFQKLELPGVAAADSAHPSSPSFAKGLRAVMEMPPERVRAAAALVYQDLFGAPPPSPVRRVMP